MFSLSRWSGGLVDRFGPRLPLTIGPLVAAIGFALFALPNVTDNFWTSFFPAVLVLGLGMAISVAPLTTTVMGSVDSEQAGVASGINNAVSRAAGLLAIAVFGVVMFQSFGKRLGEKLGETQVSDEVRTGLEAQRVRLAGVEVPAHLDPVTRKALEDAIASSFVSGFRLIMFMSVGLAIASALSAWLLIGRDSRRSSPSKPG
jgi:predicted MFS family arabinose efflux permease